MIEWRIDARQGLGFGITLMLVIIVADVVVVWLAASRPISIGTFVIGLSVLLSLALLVLLGYWLSGLARSVILLDRNALVVRWGSMEQIIPTKAIERVVLGSEVEGRIQFRGGMWPGHCIGYGEVPGIGSCLFFGTVPPREQILIATPGIAYGVSPSDYDGFLKSLRERREMGATQVVEQSSRRPGFLSWSIWQDRLGLALLAVSCAALLALLALLCFRFLSLPRMVPLHFDAAGNVDRLGTRAQLFVVPLIGLLTLLLNGVLGLLFYRREQVASYLLWGGSILIQLLVWTATVGILERL